MSPLSCARSAAPKPPVPGLPREPPSNSSLNLATASGFLPGRPLFFATVPLLASLALSGWAALALVFRRSGVASSRVASAPSLADSAPVLTEEEVMPKEGRLEEGGLEEGRLDEEMLESEGTRPMPSPVLPNGRARTLALRIGAAAAWPMLASSASATLLVDAAATVELGGTTCLAASPAA